MNRLCQEIAVITAVLSSACMAYAQTPASPQPKENVERLGPFAIAGNDYTVVLHKKHLAPNQDSAPAGTDGIVAMEIVDATGAIQYQRTYPLWADSEAVSAWQVSPHLLKGTNGIGLLVTSRPSDSSGFYQQIFGVVNGRLLPFCGPFPGMDVKADSSGDYRTAGMLGPHTDEIRVAMGTGRFVIAIPIGLDWSQGELTLAPQCSRKAAGSPHTVCRYDVLDGSSFLQKHEDTTFVRLYSQPSEDLENSQRVVVNPSSRIDLLAYMADVELKQPDFSHAPLPGEFPVKDMASISIAANSQGWLQVSIDGKAGWIHGDKDLTALGLPEPDEHIDPP